MKTYQKLIQFVVALALLAGVIAFTAYVSGSEDNVAWNSGVAWCDGGGLFTPNVAWNSGVAWVPDVSPLRVAWNA